MSADTEALTRGLEKLRRYGGNSVLGEDEANALVDHLDSLAAELERLRETWGDCEQELERVKAERNRELAASIEARGRLDKALTALREIKELPRFANDSDWRVAAREHARRCVAEIEGET